MSKLKQFPVWESDEEAEHFVDTADLSEYDFSGFVPLELALRRMNGHSYVLVASDLVAAAKAEAGRRGIPFAEVIRQALHRGLALELK